MKDIENLEAQFINDRSLDIAIERMMLALQAETEIDPQGVDTDGD